MCKIDFLVGQTVVDVRSDDWIVFDAGTKPEPRLYADVGYAVCLDSARRPTSLNDLVGRTVAEAGTDDEGTLHLAFTTLVTPPDPQYEAWQVVGGSPQHLVVCLPGGDLAVWDSRHQVTREEAEETVNLVNHVLGWDVRVKEIDGSSFTVGPAEGEPS